MKLLIITQYYPPEMGAPQARLYELAKRLKDKGHDITVLTAMPNYPTGKIFDAYKYKARLVEHADGIRIVRTCLYPSKSSKTLPRLLSYLSFGLSITGFGIWNLGKHDVALIESPPLFIMPFALWVAKWTSAKPVMMVSDIWPDIIIRMGHASPASLTTKIMLWLEKFAYHHSHTVALTNPGACFQIKQRFPELKNVSVISNGVDTKMFCPEHYNQAIRAEFNAGPEDFLVGYCGLHGLAQGLEVVVDAAEKLKDRRNIKFIMIGEGPTKESLIKRANDKNLSNLVFYSGRPKAEMPKILASLDVSLVPLSGRFPGTMPSKVYEALASGTPPIVAKACEGDLLVSKYNAGRTYEPMDAEDMARAIIDLTADRQEYEKVRLNGINLSVRFDRNVIADRTEKVLSAVHEGSELPVVDW
jgi:glycosyltransferase involved in cell wall biosynthesis